MKFQEAFYLQPHQPLTLGTKKRLAMDLCRYLRTFRVTWEKTWTNPSALELSSLGAGGAEGLLITWDKGNITDEASRTEQPLSISWNSGNIQGLEHDFLKISILTPWGCFRTCPGLILRVCSSAGPTRTTAAGRPWHPVVLGSTVWLNLEPPRQRPSLLYRDVGRRSRQRGQTQLSAVSYGNAANVGRGSEQGSWGLLNGLSLGRPSTPGHVTEWWMTFLIICICITLMLFKVFFHKSVHLILTIPWIIRFI